MRKAIAKKKKFLKKNSGDIPTRDRGKKIRQIPLNNTALHNTPKTKCSIDGFLHT
jgi:hypothetical protein